MSALGRPDRPISGRQLHSTHSQQPQYEEQEWMTRVGSGMVIGGEKRLGTGSDAIDGDHAAPNNDNVTLSTSVNVKNGHSAKKKKRHSRPTSLSLTTGVGEWLQRGVRSLAMSSWANPSASKRTSMPPASTTSRSSDVTRLDSNPAPTSTPGEVQVPRVLQEGTWMTKVSGKKQKKMFLKLDPDMGHIVWHSKQPRIIPIENIKEIRSGPSTRLHRHHFQLAQDYENLWITVIYMLEGHYKILHLIAPSEDISRMWDTTLRKLHAHRMQLMTGLGNIEERQRVWEKQYWKGADVDRDHRLTFEEVEKMCKKLNINSPRDNLLQLFKQADAYDRRYLDFEDFRRFVKLLKTRKEIVRLFESLKGKSEHFDFEVFSQFMRRDQKSTLPPPALHSLFEKYSIPVSVPFTSTSPPATPHPGKGIESYFDLRPAASRSLRSRNERLRQKHLHPSSSLQITRRSPPPPFLSSSETE
ncbi:hypothetical protein D9756_011157 [Leucocoprinus leucothites]|uniref:phosphoinositide phospholipase C n=1 Tax=Leucocoprinus leucothites TaxID=201217 RepID=A0A8H5CNH2_9AGAR|nr:hypothetical protein D9756_011157 [Leucoagaricus leucothites]